MARLKINGDIVSNDMQWVYDWYELECTCPSMVREAIDFLKDDEPITVVINSCGGDVMAGQEIYSILRENRDRVTIEIESMACSAASMIAAAGGTVRMSPVAMIMIHNASTTQAGDYREMEHTAEVLKNINSAIVQAYVEKTGMDEKDLLELMDKETWLTANQALQYGFCDEIIKSEPAKITNALVGNLSVSADMIEKARAEKDSQNKLKTEGAKLLEDLDTYGI